MERHFAGGCWGQGDGDEGECGGSHSSSYILPGEAVQQNFILSTNIRSLTSGNKLDALASLMDKYSNCIALCVQELWSLQGIPEIPGFQKLYYKSRKGNRAGGVGIFIRNNFKYTILKSPFIENVFESISIEIQANAHKSYRLVNLYIPPSVKLQDTLPLISKLPINKRNTLVVGDFNYNLANPANMSLVEEFSGLGLASLVDQPTRVVHTKTGLSKTIIDHCYTNIQSAESFVMTTDFSDHFSVATTINCNFRQRKKDKSNSFAPLQDDKSLSLLEQYLAAVDWSEVLKDKTETAFSKFNAIISESMLICCPPTARNKSIQPLNPWFSRGLLVSRKVKDRLHYRALQKGSKISWDKYKDYRNRYTKLVRLAKIKFYRDGFQSAGSNIRETWKLANQAMYRPSKKGNNSKVGPIKGCSSETETAEAFNLFYSTIAQKLADQIPKTDISFHKYLPKVADDVEELDLKTGVDELSIEVLIRKMKGKRSFSHDLFSNYALKKVRRPLLKPLSHIISLSLKLGYVPPAWKSAKCIPIYKNKGEKDDMTYYRPISILPTFSKLIERVVANRIYNHMRKNELFYENQYGFRHSHSCEHLLIKFMDRLSRAKMSNKYFLSIMIDFQKAFDTLNIEVLLEKIKHYKIGTEWLRSYMTGRTMFTQIGCKKSGLRTLTCGVPQGGVLSGLLFLLYVNCLPNSSKFFSLLFADDTTLLIEDSKIDSLFERANSYLADFQQWCYSNYLSLAPSKTRYILFSTQKEVPDLHLMNQKIIRVHEGGSEKSFKLVGVHIDDSASWHHHVEHVRKKVNMTLGMMKRSKNIIPPPVKKMIFNSLIQSHINYCISIYGSAKDTILKPLEIAQKRAIRLVNNQHFIKHTDPLFASHDCLKLKDHYKAACGLLAVKYFQQSLPPGLTDCFQEKIHKHNTREATFKTLEVPNTKNSRVIKMPKHSIANIWNKHVPDSIKDFPEASFLNAYKSHFILAYKDFVCNDANCYSCSTNYYKHMYR